MSNISRLEAIASIIQSEPTMGFDYETTPSGDLFGSNVFSLDVMSGVLSEGALAAMKATIKEGEPFDAKYADEVASKMKDWAMARGATHYSHVFYPLTGRMAQKHDSFFDPKGSGIIADFEGDLLVQQEPDGSSFPGGGIRATHEARGYTVWDPSSPAFLIENQNGITLCLPTVFLAWTGESMDLKTPLLRAQAAMGKQAERMLKGMGAKEVAPVSASGGPEQEYFLIDKNFVYARPDLMTAGRTLFGAPSPKGQEFDDHYFGTIHERVQAFMFEFEREAYKLGIPIKTRHNEVAPGQYEVAPVYQGANQSADNQQLIMWLLETIAQRHNFVCLLHEKPFAGVNGSGKHLNFSIGNSTHGNLLNPGDEPHKNLEFIAFCTAIIRGVCKNATLLRAAIASASNDHRLGANEAPPAIISIFLGSQLSDVMDQIRAGKVTRSLEAGQLDAGVTTIPVSAKHAGDRNRTSPFAFTGNKFEFRAVGSNQAINSPFVALNALMAESFDYFASELESRSGSAKVKVLAIAKDILDDCHSVLFEGNGYSEEWHAEAETRGLANLRTSADALPILGDETTTALYEKYDIMSPKETHARMEVALEQYNMTVNVESNLVVEMAKTLIYPAAVRHAGELADSLDEIKSNGIDLDDRPLREVVENINGMMKAVAELELAKAHEDEDPAAHALHGANAILPKMLEVREYADALEGQVADDLWPLPTYQEMLFIR